MVDYAENGGPVVAELLDTVAESDARGWVRVLLLARTEAHWFQELAVDHPRHDWVHPTPLRLAALSEGWTPERTAQVWSVAVRRFAARAEARGLGVPPDLAASVPARREFPTTLDLYATALLTVLDATDPMASGDPGDTDALAGVLRHEQRQVSAALRARGLELGEAGQAWAAAAVTLTAPATEPEAERVLSRVPALAGLDGERRRSLVWVLCGLYPDPSKERVWRAPRPDRLADTHLLELATRTSSRQQWCDDLAAVCGGDDPEAGVHTAAVLHRCGSTPDPTGLHRDGLALVRAGLANLVRRFPVGYVPAVVILDPVGFEADIVGAVHDDGPAGLTVAQVEALGALLRQLGFAPTRQRLGVAVSRRLVAATRPAPDAGPEALGRYAAALNNLSAWMRGLGQHEERLAAIEEAVAIRRRLASVDPDAYLAGLAGSLNNLASSLAALGRRKEALAASEEAVATHRRLAERDPATHLSDLAMSLNNLSVDLAEAGRREEGLAASGEAVAIRQRLAEADPGAHLSDLAMALNNLSNRLGDLGHHERGRAASERAVAIRRRLATADPDGQLPDLAKALTGLSVRQGDLGRHEESLAAIEEAVVIYRRFAGTNPTGYLSELAVALNNQASSLARLERSTESLATTEESVAVLRRLVDTHPAAHLPDLAMALNNLAVRLTALGRHRDGLAAIEECVAIRRRLAVANPDAYLPRLANSLSNLSNGLGQLGRHRDGLAASEEAVAIHRRLVATRPDAHLPGLAAALNNLAVQLGEVGRGQEAVATSEQAVDIYRALVAVDPTSHLRNFLISLNNLSVRLRAVGRFRDAGAVEDLVGQITSGRPSD